MCHPLGWSECPNFYGVRGLRLCPSHWRGGLVYKGMDKGSFDDVTSFILRRHQINLCLSLLKIYVPSSSTSSSPSASSQRKSASQHTCSWSQLVWYAKQLTKRNGLFFLFYFFYECITLAMWRLIKMPDCYTVWFSGKIIAFQTHESYTAS